MLPPTASMPISSGAGHDLAAVLGEHLRVAPIVNFAVVGSAPGALIEPAKPTPSLEPSESKQMMSPRAISPCFTSADHITPELMMSSSDEMSYGVPFGLGLLERAHHRLRERVADDRHLRDALALAPSRHSSCGVEVPADERDDRAAERQRLERA